MKDPDFSDLQVVVTGAAGALGGAVTGLLLQCGATCHLPARSQRSADSLEASFSHPRSIVRPGVDLTDETAVRSFYESLPGLWASIHCAGGFAMAPLTETGLEDLRAMWSINVASAFLCSREAVRAIRSRSGNGGRIVNVVARAALEPRTGAGMASYTASKAALSGLTVALGEELAAEEIFVNAVAPSILDTPANRRSMPDADFSKWPRVEDVARTIAFLASTSNRTTRGAIVPVYGRS